MTVRKPSHVSFIMDGNGRWAVARNQPRQFGHHEGTQRFKEIMYTCAEVGIPYCSFYAFSKENWVRPKEEVDTIMSLWKLYLDGEIPKMQENNIRVRVIGDRKDLPADMLKTIENTEAQTAHCTGTQALVTVSYSGRWELTETARILAQDVKDGTIDVDDITEELFDSKLATAGAPDVDLLIRTSGEVRISNYLLWQLSYAEMMFVDVPWPEFTREKFLKCLEMYGDRERRYGGVVGL